MRDGDLDELRARRPHILWRIDPRTGSATGDGALRVRVEPIPGDHWGRGFRVVLTFASSGEFDAAGRTPRQALIAAEDRARRAACGWADIPGCADLSQRFLSSLNDLRGDDDVTKAESMDAYSVDASGMTLDEVGAAHDRLARAASGDSGVSEACPSSTGTRAPRQ